MRSQFRLGPNTKHASYPPFCKELPLHPHSENQVKNELLNELLRPQLFQSLNDRETAFKKIYSTTHEGCSKQTARSHDYRNRFKLGQHLTIGQKSTPRKSQKVPQEMLKTATTSLGTFHKHDITNPGR